MSTGSSLILSFANKYTKRTAHKTRPLSCLKASSFNIFRVAGLVLAASSRALKFVLDSSEGDEHVMLMHELGAQPK